MRVEDHGTIEHEQRWERVRCECFEVVGDPRHAEVVMIELGPNRSFKPVGTWHSVRNPKCPSVAMAADHLPLNTILGLARALTQALMPTEILHALHVGRFTALQKPSGRARVRRKLLCSVVSRIAQWSSALRCGSMVAFRSATTPAQ